MKATDFHKALIASGLYKSIPLTASQALDGITAKASALSVSAEDLAYMIATAIHEVGPTLIPKRESLNYSIDGLLAGFGRHRISEADARRLGRKKNEKAVPEARQKELANVLYGGSWGFKNLGNRVGTNDGWDYRGGGYPQTTGYSNYLKVKNMTGVDVINAPDLIKTQSVAIDALVHCMIKGTYTGRKLSDYRFPAQYKSARAIINNDVEVNGASIADKANKVLAALKSAGYRPGAPLAETKAESKPTTSSGVKGTIVTGVAAASGATAVTFWESIQIKASEFLCWVFGPFCGG